MSAAFDRAAFAAAAPELVAATAGEVRFAEPLAGYTTLRVGGPADALAFPTGVAAVQRLRALCQERGWPCHVLGQGSNLLVRDGGVRGLLIATTRLRRLERDEERGVRCEAGVLTSKLLAQATAWHLGGLEFLAGIPGTVGGGLVMNAGTREGELGAVTLEVTSVDAAGELRGRTREECGFRYRGSDLGGEEIVVAARLGLTPRPREAIEARVGELREARRGREPKGGHSAGSIFKNPPGELAGRLLEAAGLKGRRVGGAEVSTVHANWIVNWGGATAADVLALVALCRAEVARQSGVELELEVRIVGEEEA